MRFNILSDTYWEARLAGTLDELSKLGYFEFFGERSYGEGLSGVTVVFVCRDPAFDSKRRIVLSKKERRLYIDVLLDLPTVMAADLALKKMIIAERLVEEVPQVVSRYDISAFDGERFIADLRAWVLASGWLASHSQVKSFFDSPNLLNISRVPDQEPAPRTVGESHVDDSPSSPGPSESADLKTLLLKKKFVEEDFYPGAPTESLRVDAENQINRLLERLLDQSPADLRKGFVLSEFKAALSAFHQTDTEERERFCGYLEEIMEIVGIESSDGLLNAWLYGFDPGEADV